jgi:hypothetical protein
VFIRIDDRAISKRLLNSSDADVTIDSWL